LIAAVLEIKRLNPRFGCPRIAQQISHAKNNSPRLKLGGKPRYVLSGLLRCAVCGANYHMGDAHKYACDSYLHGGVALCSNSERVRRDRIEEVILGPIRRDLLAPERVAKMARVMEAEYERRLRRGARTGVRAAGGNLPSWTRA
jgi:hypothetical protein